MQGQFKQFLKQKTTNLTNICATSKVNYYLQNTMLNNDLYVAVYTILKTLEVESQLDITMKTNGKFTHL